MPFACPLALVAAFCLCQAPPCPSQKPTYVRCRDPGLLVLGALVQLLADAREVCHGAPVPADGGADDGGPASAAAASHRLRRRARTSAGGWAYQARKRRLGHRPTDLKAVAPGRADAKPLSAARLCVLPVCVGCGRRCMACVRVREWTARGPPSRRGTMHASRPLGWGSVHSGPRHDDVRWCRGMPSCPARAQQDTKLHYALTAARFLVRASPGPAGLGHWQMTTRTSVIEPSSPTPAGDQLSKPL